MIDFKRIKANILPLYSLPTWQSISDKELVSILSLISEEVAHQLRYVETKTYGFGEMPRLKIATFEHKASGVLMQLIPGSTFQLGLSSAEERAFQDLQGEEPSPIDWSTAKPISQVQVSPFFLSKFPVLDQFAYAHTEIDEMLFRPEFSGESDTAPIYLTLEELAPILQKYAFQLPSEVQWEYACRGGMNSLFYYGNSLDDETVIENSICLSDFADQQTADAYANSFGLIGLGLGEWCADSWSNSYLERGYSELPFNNPSQSHKVIRAGAAALYPWQDGAEWVLAISAYRGSSEGLEDATFGARLLLPIYS